MSKNQRVPAIFCRAALLAAFAVSGSVCLHAQQKATSTVAELHQPTTLFFGGTGAETPKLDLTDNGIAYSSSTGSDALAAAENYSLGGASGAAQPPPRRRYGRPNYSDKMHNPDGSSKIAFLIGGGLTEPVFTSTNYLKLSYKLQTGIGYNFNKNFGVIAQFDYDHFALPGKVIANQLTVYNAQNYTYSDGSTVDFSGLDGSTHDWSLTLNPTYNFHQGDTTGAYVVVGGGFYHKVTNFTLPQTGQYCDYYGYCYSYQANQTFDSYVSNSAGVSGGLGFTYKPSRFASERLYAEARYVFNFNQQRNATSTNLYPGNSATTSYIPVTVGIRF